MRDGRVNDAVLDFVKQLSGGTHAPVHRAARGGRLAQVMSLVGGRSTSCEETGGRRLRLRW